MSADDSLVRVPQRQLRYGECALRGAGLYVSLPDAARRAG